MTFRARLFVLLLLLVALSSFAADGLIADRGERMALRTARHFILDPQHVLSDAERADLASIGCAVQRALPGGKYLVRISGDWTDIATDLRVKSLTPLAAAEKMDVSAYRAAAEAKPFARVHVIFHDDTSLVAARRAIEDAGGSVDDPLATAFAPLRSLRAHVPSASLFALASDEAVLSVYAARTFRATTWNADEAAL